MNTAVYPVTSDNVYLFRALKKYSPESGISTAVIPKAFAAVCNPGNDSAVHHKLSELSDDVDTVRFFSYWDKKKIISGIREMILSGKEIICHAVLQEKEREHIQELASRNHVRITLPAFSRTLEKIRRRDEAYTHPESIVVAIGSITEGLDTSSEVVELYDELTEMGYRVSVLATNPDLDALGFDILPMDELSVYRPEQSVMLINRYMNHHQFIYQADIVLLQIPNEGLHRTSLKYEVGFGVRTYVISQAISIDYGVMLSPVMDPYAQTYEALSEIAEKRYGFQYDCIKVVPKVVDEYDPLGAEKVKYCGIPGPETDEIIDCLRNSAKESGIEIRFFHSQPDWAKRTAADLVQKLSS